MDTQEEGVPTTPLGLTKTALRISSGGGGGVSGGGSKGVFRRFNSTPVAPVAMTDLSSPGQGGNKENSILGRKDTNNSANPLRARTPLDNHDSNSQDSGCAVDEQRHLFRFAEPSGIAPRKSTTDPSPKKLLVSPGSIPRSNSSMGSGGGDRFSFSSVESFDDGFLELSDLDKSFPDDNTENMVAPVGLGNLLTGQLMISNSTNSSSVADVVTPKDEEMFSCRTLRRANSLMETYNSHASSRIRVSLFGNDLSPDIDGSPSDKSFKRPRDVEGSSAKRRKSNSLQVISDNSPRQSPVTSRFKIQRSISETTATSLAAMLHQSYATPDLIGDFSKPFALPLVSGRHDDLKSISPETLAALMKGDYEGSVSCFKIIDCRYPYEYEGGHIRGSLNLYTKEQIEGELMVSTQGQHKLEKYQKERASSTVLVFHCEFSLERGPALSRFLRQRDRVINNYPTLHFPEMYLLHGGYRNFFSSQKELCDPCSYLPMGDPKHVSDLKKFRCKSNSWNGGGKQTGKHNALKRLGL